jgi:hypothetical protein
MIKFLELALSQEVYEYLEELDEMNWSAWGNLLNQYLRNTSIGTTVSVFSAFDVVIFHMVVTVVKILELKIRGVVITREYFWSDLYICGLQQ